jgi:hypothetical protein
VKAVEDKDAAFEFALRFLFILGDKRKKSDLDSADLT